MNDRQWRAVGDFFKQRFPACHQCQKGHQGPETMLAHLVASHFKREVIATFGKGMSCSLCSERLPQHIQSFKQYYVLNHMTKHIELIAPKEAQCLMVPNGIVARTKIICESESSVDANNTKEICVSEKLFEEVEASEDEENDTGNFVNGNRPEIASDLNHEAISVSKFPDPDYASCNTSQEHNSQKLTFQVCQEYFRNKYPTCKTCKKGHEWISNMKRHLVMGHFGKEAIRLFGSGNTCAVCNNFSTDTNNYKNGSIKIHMKEHLDIIFPDERGRDLLRLISNKHLSQCKNSSVSMWQDCQEYFKNKYSSCQTCKVGHSNFAKLKCHLASVHYSKRAIECFGPSNTCPICQNFSIKPIGDPQIKQIKRHMGCHLEDFIPDEKARAHLNNMKTTKGNIMPAKRKPPGQRSIKNKGLYQDCQDYFRDKYPSCKTCQNGHVSFQKLKRHLTVKHCADRAMTLFGTGNMCQVCKKFSTNLDRSWPIVNQVKFHMATHLEHFIEDDQAKDLLIKPSILCQRSKELINIYISYFRALMIINKAQIKSQRPIASTTYTL